VAQRFEVPARKFFPQPKVDATVLVFERPNLADPALAPSTEEWPGLSAFIDAAFGQRRKMLVNSLAGCWKIFPGKEKVLEALEALSIPIKTRAEDLSPQVFLRLYRQLH
jgi:16S rRNA (adenine1518-N6/adenine1519-N6)-dimethyltransferase